MDEESSKAFANVAASADLDDVTQHVLRHTAAVAYAGGNGDVGSGWLLEYDS